MLYFVIADNERHGLVLHCSECTHVLNTEIKDSWVCAINEEEFSNQLISTATTVTVQGIRTLLMAMRRIQMEAPLVACTCGRREWTLWSIDSLPGG